MEYIRVKEANCKNCYKCLKYCYVKSISYINDHVEVIADQCILCGRCINVCPQKAKTVVNDPARIYSWLTQPSEHVVASLAPSYIGIYGEENRGRLFEALRRLGFDSVEETAVGAKEVTREYKRLLDGGKMPSILTTCCPTVNMLVEKYFPDLVPLLAPVVSPVLAHGRLVKKRDGTATRVVFIGPCLSKIKEIDEHPESADGALSFRQLDELLSERGLDLSRMEDVTSAQPPAVPAPFSSIYPVPEGILRDVKRQPSDGPDGRGTHGYHFLSVCGLGNVIAFLKEMQAGKCGRVFAELNSCEGGCVNGPLIPERKRTPYAARLQVENYALAGGDGIPGIPPAVMNLEQEFCPDPVREDEPDEKTIRRILTEIGKPTPDKELNCGSCGYPTCRDKAIAVYHKKAELYMCLPYFNDLSQSLSNVTLSVTPNFIIAADRELRIVEMNLAAQKCFRVSRKQALKSDLYEYMDPADFERVFETKETICDKKVRLGTMDATILETLIYVADQDLVIGFFKDITEEEKRRDEQHKARLEAADMAQKVIEKQMIAAQEIASLLGETTAETKVTLNNLKTQILSESGE